jgi:hypothetical protein
MDDNRRRKTPQQLLQGGSIGQIDRQNLPIDRRLQRTTADADRIVVQVTPEMSSQKSADTGYQNHSKISRQKEQDSDDQSSNAKIAP